MLEAESVQSKETKKYGFGSSFLKSSPLPSLYQWLWQAKAAFVSKFSLYFHETLAAQSSPSEMKALISRQGQACDYVSKIQSFQRRSDAVSVCLVFEAAGVEHYRGAGYHHPEESVPPPKGLDSYPAIFTYPPTRPLERWPSIVMRVSDRSNEHALLDHVVHFFDQQIGSTYFLCRVEPRITFVAIFDSKKSEKDSYIRDFIYDLVMQLRCNKVFANLKPK
nr:KICSTOR subunit 2-like [Cherax quadricarinatus]